MTLKHILSTQQFLNEKVVEDIFDFADTFEKADKKRNVPKLLRGKILACVFYEPSTRTRFSFESAMLKLGGAIISKESAGHFSSAIKGETLEDTIRIISGYRDHIPITDLKMMWSLNRHQPLSPILRCDVYISRPRRSPEGRV